MARALYILVRTVWFLLCFMNLSICALVSATAMGVAADSSLLLSIVSLLITIFLWLGAMVTRSALSGKAPAWLRVFWLTGLIGNTVAVYLYFISIALRADEPSLGLFSLDALARLSGRRLLAVAAGTVAIAANAVVTEWLSQWRQAIARAKYPRSVVPPPGVEEV